MCWRGGTTKREGCHATCVLRLPPSVEPRRGREAAAAELITQIAPQSEVLREGNLARFFHLRLLLHLLLQRRRCSSAVTKSRLRRCRRRLEKEEEEEEKEEGVDHGATRRIPSHVAPPLSATAAAVTDSPNNWSSPSLLLLPFPRQEVSVW